MRGFLDRDELCRGDDYKLRASLKCIGQRLARESPVPDTNHRIDDLMKRLAESERSAVKPQATEASMRAQRLLDRPQ